MAQPTKMIVVPVDGSQNGMKSLDYVTLVFGPENDMEVTLLYVLPTLPPCLVDDPKMSRKRKVQLTAVTNKNIDMAERILAQAKKALQKEGFREDHITTKLFDGSRSAADDILKEAKRGGFGTIFLGRKGQSGVKAYSMGSVAGKVQEASAGMAVAIVP